MGDYHGGYLGRINKSTGRFTKGHDYEYITDEIKDHLMAFALNPLKVSVEHGKATNNCCYCGKDLTQEDSKSAGYGPICAKKYNLPWGEK